MATTHKTFCRNCTHSCGLIVTVEDGRPIAVGPDREHPISDGYLCIKAQANVELHQGSDGRLVHSIKRQPDGAFTQIEAMDAIDEIGDRLKAIIAAHGPRSVGIYLGTGGYFNSLVQPLAKAWLHEVGSPNFFTSSTVDQSASWVTMMRMGFVASGKPHPAEVDALMLVGANPLVSHWLPGFNPSKRLREWKKRGMRTIVVDPRRTETARMADIHLQLRPGEDVTLFAGMIRVLLDNGWQDQAFCDRYVGGIETLRAAVAPYTPEYVERRAGVAGDALVEAVRIFASSGKSLVFTGTGISMSPHSNLAVHMAQALNALCGGYRRPGDVVSNPGVMMPKSYSDMVIPPSRPWETGVQCRSTPTGKIYGEIPTGALPGEILEPGPDKIRALIVVGGNPVKALGQPDKTLRAFRDLELLVSLDVRQNDTVNLADYAIAAALPMERHDVSYIFDGLAWSNRPFVQYAAPITAPPPGVIDETLFFWGIARRMGIALEYRKIGLSVSYADAPAGHKLDMTTPPDPEHYARWWLEGSAVDFDALRDAPGGIAPDLPVHTVQATADNGARMDLCPSDVAAELATVFGERTDAARPYRLAVRRLLETMNSAYRQSSSTARRYPVNPAFMNPDDMTNEGLTSGDRIEIASRHGALFGKVQADTSVRPGMISMAHCWGETDLERDVQQEQGSFTGRLVSLDEDVEPINHMPTQSGISVAIRKAIDAAA
jgi:anaerobic selenocysteine-containing dehydrogenase